MEKITTEYITLQQFMKLSGIVSTGGEAKLRIKEMDIVVNGEKENRRGRNSDTIFHHFVSAMVTRIVSAT